MTAFTSRAGSDGGYAESCVLRVRQCLADAGFSQGKLRLFGGASSDVSPDDYMQRLTGALQQIGPIYSEFGLYMSSRVDLLSLPDCIELAKIPNRATRTPPDEIRRILISELGDNLDGDSDGDRQLASFDPEPYESRLLFQLHYAELDNGDLVVTKILHPHRGVDQDLQLLSQLEEAFAPKLADRRQFQRCVEDFRQIHANASDCRATAECLDMLAHDARDLDGLSVPTVYMELCSKSILVTERLEGRRLDKYVSQARRQTAPFYDGTASVAGIIPDELARQLCDHWLRQAFDGALLPIELRPENVLVRSASEIAILDGTFAVLPAVSKANLLEYFIAVAAEEPTRAMDCLLKETDDRSRKISRSSLDRQFRQVVAFREGGWEDGGRPNCLSDTLFAQWRLASRNGYQPLRHLVHVFRGAFHVTFLARQLAPGRDSLLEGVKDLRLTKLLRDMRQMIEPGYWAGQMDRLGALMIFGPKYLDAALTAASADDSGYGNSATIEKPSRRPAPTLVSAVLALLVVILCRGELASAITPEWAERLSALLFLGIGGWMLRLLVTKDEP